MTQRNAFTGIIIALGTTACRVLGRVCQLVGPGIEGTGVITTDYDWSHSLPGDDPRRALPPGTHTGLGCVDPTVREQLQADGSLWRTPPGCTAGEGVGREGLGAGSDPRTGAELFVGIAHEFRSLVRRELTKIWSHIEQRRKLAEDQSSALDVPVVQVVALFSTAGGVGSGCAPLALQEARYVADQMGIEVKLIPVALPLGSLEPPNVQQARRNQKGVLRWLVSNAVGASVANPFNGRHDGNAVDSLFAISNVNRHGLLPDLASLEELTAQALHITFFTPAEQTFRERIIDLDNNRNTDFAGAPCMVNTVGYAALSANRANALDFLAANTATQWFAGLTLKGNGRHTIGELEKLHGSDVVETEDESRAFQRVDRTANLPAGSAVAHARHQFVAEATGAGFQRARRLSIAYQRVRDMTLAYLLDMVGEQTSALHAEWAERFNDLERKFCTLPNGPRQALDYFRLAQQALQAAHDANQRKHFALHDNATALEQNVDDARRSVERYARVPPVLRWLFVAGIRQCARVLETDGEEATATRLEVEIRHVLETDVYQPLLDALSETVARFERIVHQAGIMKDACAADADEYRQRAGQPLPAGQELLGPEMLDRLWKDFAAREHGLQPVLDNLMRSCLSRHGSLAILDDSSRESLRLTIVQAARAELDGEARRFGPARALRLACRDMAAIDKHILQAIRESEGRLKVPVAPGIRRLKLIAVPDAAEASWFVERVRRLDKDPGDWQVVELGPGCDAIRLIQYVAGLSPRMLFPAAGAAVPGDAAVRQAHAYGPDPITAFAPSPRLAPWDPALALGRAWALDGLRVDETDGVALEAGQDRIHAKTLAELERQLAHEYPVAAKLHKHFCLALAHDPAPLLERLGMLKQATLNGLGGEVRDRIGPAALDRLLAETSELRRYFDHHKQGVIHG